MIDRRTFISICFDAIKATREHIIIGNQISGYKKCHHEIRDNDFLHLNVLKNLNKVGVDDCELKHHIIDTVGLAHCHEVADYLLIEIAKRLRRVNARAKI